MSDLYCAKCSEPWDAYGVRHHIDMNFDESQQFLRGEGCPSCAFGIHCPLCNGSGRTSEHSHLCCKICSGKGYTLAWSPRKNAGRFHAGEFYVGYEPSVHHVSDPGFDAPCVVGVRRLPEKCGSHQTQDGWIDEWWIVCPSCSGARMVSDLQNVCAQCSGKGSLVIIDANAAIEKAAAAEIEWSDEDPMEILDRRRIFLPEIPK